MTRISIRHLLLVALTLSIPLPTVASPVTWEFAGEVTSVRDDENLFGGEVSIGSLFSGFFTFESTAGDSSSGSNSAIYRGSVKEFIGQVGSFPFLGPIETNAIIVRNGSSGLPSDGFGVSSSIMFLDSIAHISLSFVDDDGTIFTNDFLPTDPPLLHEFDSAEFLILITQGKGSPITRIDGVVTTLVPEPSTLLLLSLGAGLIFKRKRSR